MKIDTVFMDTLIEANKALEAHCFPTPFGPVRSEVVPAPLEQCSACTLQAFQEVFGVVLSKPEAHAPTCNSVLTKAADAAVQDSK